MRKILTLLLFFLLLSGAFLVVISPQPAQADVCQDTGDTCSTDADCNTGVKCKVSGVPEPPTTAPIDCNTSGKTCTQGSDDCTASSACAGKYFCQSVSNICVPSGAPAQPPATCIKEGDHYEITNTSAQCCSGLEPRENPTDPTDDNQRTCVNPSKNPIPVINPLSTLPKIGEEFTVRIDKCVKPMNVYCEGPADNIPHTFLDRKKCAIATERVDNQTTGVTFQFDKTGRFSFMVDCAGGIAISEDVLIEEVATSSPNADVACSRCSPEFPYPVNYVKCEKAKSGSSATCTRKTACSKVRIVTNAIIEREDTVTGEDKMFADLTTDYCPAHSCVVGKGCDYKYPAAGVPPCIEGLDGKGNKVTVDMAWFDPASGAVLAGHKEEAKNASQSIVICTKTNTGVGPIETDPAGLIRSILGLLLSISGMVALYFIIRSGYQIMTSRGNPEAIQEARERLTSAIAGLLFIIFSLVILSVIGVDLLKIPGFGNS